MVARSSRLLLLMLGLVVALGANTVQADDFVASGTKTYVNKRFDNLIIAKNAKITLKNCRIDGNIIVKSNAQLKADNIRVDGNIQAERAKVVNVIKSRIGGSFQIDNNRATVKLDRTKVNGDVQVFSTKAQNHEIRIIRNDVGGNVQAESNRSKKFVVSWNIIDGNLQGESNNKRPTGTGNLVQGDTDGQFENF